MAREPKSYHRHFGIYILSEKKKMHPNQVDNPPLPPPVVGAHPPSVQIQPLQNAPTSLKSFTIALPTPIAAYIFSTAACQPRGISTPARPRCRKQQRRRDELDPHLHPPPKSHTQLSKDTEQI
ncbi:hypothetical protein ASPCAL01872 [Aspergillus calidoustus]|uniref:Uncharacterized protein n=1 Tax=Aspergillus calidoustus TaxID=454130 RepID=A0A0U5GKP1_ASPCI|nr:hypothetical protein ASPCAL01872 [Aspergillus calidoustus]